MSVAAGLRAQGLQFGQRARRTAMSRIRMITIELATQAALAMAVGVSVSVMLAGVALLLAGSAQV